jgi:hypothetical protein
MIFVVCLVLGCASAALLLALSARDSGESHAETETSTGPTAGVVTITITDDSCDDRSPSRMGVPRSSS